MGSLDKIILAFFFRAVVGTSLNTFFCLVGRHPLIGFVEPDLIPNTEIINSPFRIYA